MAESLQQENDRLRAEIEELRADLSKSTFQIEIAQRRLKDYDKAPRARLGAIGGWWSVQDRPKGKGSEAKAGWYLRIPNQPAYKREKITGCRHSNTKIISDRVSYKKVECIGCGRTRLYYHDRGYATAWRKK